MSPRTMITICLIIYVTIAQLGRTGSIIEALNLFLSIMLILWLNQE